MKRIVLAAVIALLCSCEREKEDDFGCPSDKWSQVSTVERVGFEDDCEEWKRLHEELKQRVEESERKKK